MSEKTLRLIFLSGTGLFLLILIGMTINTLNQVIQSRTPPVTAEVADGKKMWQQRNCNDCHTILGIGGYYAPDLTKVIDNRGSAWIALWLANPAGVKSNAEMPNQNLTGAEIQNLVSFFTWVGKVDTNNWPPKPVANLLGGGTGTNTGEGTGLNGALLFQQGSCIGCHMINGAGATGPGPDLSHIGSQPYDGLGNSASDLTKWLQDPQAVKPGTIMPKLPLTQPQIDALVQYLLTLK